MKSIRLLGLALWIAVGAISIINPSAKAQSSDSNQAANQELSKKLFQEGVTFVEQEKWERALARFERAYALTPKPLILYNIAVAQMSTGRLVQAAESYNKFLKETSNGKYPEFRKDAQQALASLSTRMAYVVLEPEETIGERAIELDGKRVNPSEYKETIRIDPGSHKVAVVDNGVILSTESFDVLEGQTTRVHVAAPLGKPIEESKQEDDKKGGGILRSPIFWAVTGVVVAAGVTGGVLYATRSSGDGFTGNIGSGSIAVR